MYRRLCREGGEQRIKSKALQHGVVSAVQIIIIQYFNAKENYNEKDSVNKPGGPDVDCNL